MDLIGREVVENLLLHAPPVHEARSRSNGDLRTHDNIHRWGSGLLDEKKGAISSSSRVPKSTQFAIYGSVISNTSRVERPIVDPERLPARGTTALLTHQVHDAGRN